MKSCYGYIRVSTVKQGLQGVSLQEQKDAIQRYCQRNAIEIVDWFEERETAAKAGRPVFNQMLRLLRQGKASGVVLHKIDRGARNLKDWACLGELIDRDIDIHFANESLDLRSRGGRLSADIQAVVAADYIRNLREETRKGFYGRLKQGLYPIGAPVGYVDNGRGQAKTPDPVMGPLIRYAFETYAAGDSGLNALVEDLHRRGLRNKRGGKVTRNGLSVILNNPFYMGLIRLRTTGEVFPGVHEPIVSKPLFDAVRSHLRRKTSKGVRKHRYRYRRMLTCGYCGYSLIGERQKGRIYYRCHTPDCPTRCVTEDLVDEQLKRCLAPLRFSTEEAACLEACAHRYLAQWREERESALQALRLQKARTDDRLGRLTDAFLDGAIEKPLFEERKKRLYEERLDIEGRIAGLESGPDAARARIQEFLELAKSVYTKFLLGNPDEKRHLLKIVTSNRHVHEKNLVVDLQIPFRQLAQRPKHTSGDPFRDRPRTFDFSAIFNRLIQESDVELDLGQSD